MNSDTMFQTTVIFVLAIVIILLCMRLRKSENTLRKVDKLETENANLLTDRTKAYEQVKAIAKQRTADSVAYGKLITQLKQKPLTERAAILSSRIGGEVHVMVTPNDTQITMQPKEMDSINAIVLHADYLEDQLKLCDSSTTLQNSIIHTDSVVMANQAYMLNQYKKQHKKDNRKLLLYQTLAVASSGGLLVLLFVR